MTNSPNFSLFSLLSQGHLLNQDGEHITEGEEERESVDADMEPKNCRGRREQGLSYTSTLFTHGKSEDRVGGVLVITNKGLPEHAHCGGHRGSCLSAAAL